MSTKEALQGEKYPKRVPQPQRRSLAESISSTQHNVGCKSHRLNLCEFVVEIVFRIKFKSWFSPTLRLMD